MTIKTHTESSKSELSSRGKRPFKVSKYFTDDNYIDDKNISGAEGGVIPPNIFNLAKLVLHHEQRSVGTRSGHVRSEHVRNTRQTLGTSFAVDYCVC